MFFVFSRLGMIFRLLGRMKLLWIEGDFQGFYLLWHKNENIFWQSQIYLFLKKSTKIKRAFKFNKIIKLESAHSLSIYHKIRSRTLNSQNNIPNHFLNFYHPLFLKQIRRRDNNFPITFQSFPFFIHSQVEKFHLEQKKLIIVQ